MPQVFLLMDIGINFNLAYQVTSGTHEKQWDARRPAIVDRYFKTWFFVDFTTALPLSIILPSQAGASNKLLRAFRMVRLLRLRNVGLMAGPLQRLMHPAIFRVVSIHIKL